MSNGVMMQVMCHECGRQEGLAPERWRCDCGGAWEPLERTDFDPELIDRSDTSVWRYRRLYDLDLAQLTANLGAGWTPLVPMLFGGRPVIFKLEFVAPTSSFKDRGTGIMIGILVHQLVTAIAEDSSGNAGASVAAHAARAGLCAEIYVPAHASPAKQAQIAFYGADLRPIPGPRANATLAAHAAVGKGRALASTAYHPGYLLGQESAAWELWEQLGRHAPDWIVMPVGQGGGLLGHWLGFRRLRAAGLVSRLPRLVAVQSACVAPLWLAYSRGLDTVPPVEPRCTSVAEGIATANPVRGRRMLQAIRESGGTCVTVNDDQVLSAQARLARRGLWVEPTSATSVAALEQVYALAAPDETIVVPLTGSGLKGSTLQVPII